MRLFNRKWYLIDSGFSLSSVPAPLVSLWLGRSRPDGVDPEVLGENFVCRTADLLR
jgi:hypothetical protein